MKYTNLGGESSIRRYVDRKLNNLAKSRRTFDALFPLMFSERENTFFEWDESYEIRKMSYGEAYDKAEKRGAYLRSILGKDGSPVGIAMENSADFIIDFWAVLHAGHAPLLMNLRLGDETLEEALRDAGASAVISDGGSYSVPTIRSDLLHENAENAEQEETSAPFGDRFTIMSSGTSDHVKLCAYTAEEVFTILGDSKAIVLKSRAMQRHYEGELKQLAFLPFYHIFGFVAVYLWFAFYSRTFVKLDNLAPDTILSTVKRHKVTHIFAVPLFWEKVREAAMRTIKGRGSETYAKFRKGMKIAGSLSKNTVLFRVFTKNAFREVRRNLFGESISFLISGGGTVSQETLLFFNAIGYHLSNGYGMTEIGIASVELSDKPSDRISGSVGEPLSSYRFGITEDGKLTVSGNALSPVILSGGKRTERTERFETGDLARCERNRYFISGREDDLIVSSDGENLNPNLIEQKLLFPGIMGLALVGVPSGSTVVPTVVVSVSQYASEDARTRIRDAVRKALSDAKCDKAVRKIVFTSDPLLRADEFKLNRKRIADDLKSGAIREIQKETEYADAPEDAVERKVSELFRNALSKESVSKTGDFFTEEGGSSLDYLLMQSEIQKEFGLSLPKDFGTEPHSVETVSKYIRDEIDGVHEVL